MKLSINWKMTISIKWISVKRPPVGETDKKNYLENIIYLFWLSQEFSQRYTRLRKHTISWNMLSVLKMFIDCVLRFLFSVLGWFIVYNI